MRLHRPVLAGLALSAVLPVTAANAAAGVTAAGSALSTATLATISVGALLDVVEATSVDVGTLSAGAQTITSDKPAVTFVPITLNDVETGAVTVTPDNSPQTVGGVSTGDLGVVSASSPSATLVAAGGAAPTSTLTSSLGSASILGLPLTLDGGVDVGSVTDASHAQAGKAVTFENLALPNIADLLAALGLDLAKLPAATLNALLTDLRVALSQATEDAVAAANDAIDDAQADVDAKQTEVANATTALSTATTALNDALASATIPPAVTLPSGVTAPLDATEWDQVPAIDQALIEAANPGLGAIADTYEAAKTALDTLQGELDTLQGVLDTALAALAGLVEGVLGDLPLVSIGAADVATRANVTGTTKVAEVTGAISDVQVLGVDILSDVTGESSIDAAELVGDVADDVNAALNTVSTALSNALSTVTGATGLVIPAPEIALMVKETSTGVDGAYGIANATVTALSISLGSATVPSLYALTGAASLPGIAPITEGFQTAPLSVQVGVLSESARFSPATTTTDPGTHPATGGPEGLAIVAVIGTALAIGVRRRLATAE